MKAFTDINILVDRSGSMWSIKASMEEALKNFVKEHAKNESTRISLTQFDSVNDSDIVFKGVPAGSVEASQLTITPRGSTPLYDAFGKLIDTVGLRYSEMKESDRPDQVLFVIITDGCENASIKFRAADISRRVNTQHNQFNWQFVYLGANQDAIETARGMGILKDWAITYAATPTNVQNVYSALVTNTMNYANASTGRGDLLTGFTDSQRKSATE